MNKLENRFDNEYKNIGLGKKILYLTPSLVTLGGLVSWGVCAHYDSVPSGIVLFGISVFFL